VSDLRNILKGQSVDATTADQLHTIGGRVFLGQDAVAALRDFAAIADSWRGVHALAYGGPIGGTDSVTTHQMQTDNVEAILTPTGTALHDVVAVQVANGGGAPMTADLLVGGVVVASGLTINPSESAGFDIKRSLTVGASTPLQVHLTSGSASDAIAKAATVLVGL